eukprot:11535434-Alexandrium_andersonii.AAC.1
MSIELALLTYVVSGCRMFRTSFSCNVPSRFTVARTSCADSMLHQNTLGIQRHSHSSLTC